MDYSDDVGPDFRFLRNQSIEVGDPVRGESKVRRNTKFPIPITKLDPDVTTLYDVFMKSAREGKDHPYLGTRVVLPNGKRGAYEWMNYGTAAEKVAKMGSGLVHVGVQKGDRVGIFAINVAEWVLTDFACHSYSFVGVALYATLGANAVEYVVNHAEISVVLCDEKNIDKCLNLDSCKVLKTIISFTPPSAAQQQRAKERGLQLLALSELMELGQQNPHPADPPAAADLATIMYTSGSTGNPKGVMLTHANWVAEIAAVHHLELEYTSNEVHMSYLPLAHSFERAAIYALTSLGARVGFFSGVIADLFHDISELKPTFLVGAPRVWQRLHDKMWLTINQEGWLKRTLFHWGVQSKMASLKSGGSTPFWDSILFSQTKAKLGGNVRFILSGAAPLDPVLADFLKACFCCPVVQGYGLTEICGGSFMTHRDDPTTGHVGPPMSCNEVKLIDVPEMNYFHTDKPCPRGEICVRGANVFIGYYKDPEKTAEDLRPDGWFHTGDIGRWNLNGTLSIIDRKKNIFKLSQGEYVAAEYLEGVFTRSQYVSQIFVYGDSLNSFLVGIIVPDFEVLVPIAKDMGIPNPEDKEGLCKNKQVEKLILDSLTTLGKEANLGGFELLKSIALEPNAFAEENNLLTPTFKLRRPNLKEHYQQKIGTLYADYKRAHPEV